MKIGLIDGIHLWPTRLLNQPAFPSCVPCFRFAARFVSIYTSAHCCTCPGRQDRLLHHPRPLRAGFLRCNFRLVAEECTLATPYVIGHASDFHQRQYAKAQSPPPPNLHKYRNEYAGRVVVELGAFVTTSPRCISFLGLRRPNKAFKRGTRNQLGRLTRKIEVGDAETSRADIYLHLFGVIMTDNWAGNG
jgi:hypothetical protein